MAHDIDILSNQQGRGLSLDLSSAADQKLLRDALHAGWDIPAEILHSAPRTMIEILANPDASDRNKIAAAKTLVAMKTANIAAVKVLLDASQPAPEHKHLHLHAAPGEKPLAEMTDAELEQWAQEPTAPIESGNGKPKPKSKGRASLDS